MAKLTDRTELNEAPNDLDLIHIVDSSDTTDDPLGTSKYITITNLIKSYVESLTSYFNVTSGTSDDITEGATNLFFTSTEQTKLSGIETGADVTDTANVTSAGALMDSEVDANIKTLSIPANTTISTFGASFVDDATADAARTTLGVDPTGTDNSTDVTLAGTGTYITIAGQVITVDPITESDISDLGAYITGITGEPLSDISDVTITTIAADEVLKWNGTAWINQTLAEAGISAAGHTHTKSEITDLSAYEVGGTDVAVADGGTGASTASGARANLGVDVAGTDNSTDVTLAGTPNYLTIVGQVITRALIDLTTHVTGLLPDGNISSASTWNSKIANVVEDTTPQAGGNFDLNKKLLGDASFYANGNSGTAFTINTNNGKYQTMTLTGSVTLTFTAPTTLSATAITVLYTWDATGGWDITHPTSVVPMGAFPTFTGATSGQRVAITYLWDGTNYHAESGEIY